MISSHDGAASDKPLVLHIISGLGVGGAEMMLYRLVRGSKRFRHAVVSLLETGAIGEMILATGVEVHALGLGSVLRLPAATISLPMLVNRLRPCIVQGWMTHGNIAATWAAGLSRHKAVLNWNVRQSLADLKFETRSTARVIKLSVRLSRTPHTIIYNSNAGAEEHEAIGYPIAKRHFIPNGFDTERLAPSPTVRSRMRNALGIGEQEVVIGLIARVHPWKNHEGFIEVARRVAQRTPETRFLLAGLETDGPALSQMIAAADLDERVIALGTRSDIPELQQIMDVSVNLSHGEGFANTIGEAMACGIPCLVTDVGDSAWIVGDTGHVVPAGDLDAATIALEALIQMGPARRAQLGASARSRVIQHFSIESVVDQYETLYIGQQIGRSTPNA